MEGCTAPVARPIPCKRSRTTGAAKQAGVCLVCLLLDTWAGVSPSSTRGIRATPPWRTSEEPERRAKGTPSLPLTLAPDDSERRPPHHPFDLRPRLCANGGPLPLGGSWVRTWHPPLLTRRLLHLAPAYPGVPSQPRTSPGAEGQRSDLPHPDCAPLRQARCAGRVRPPFPSCATHLSHTSTLLREPGDRGFPLGQHAPQRPDQRGIEKIP